MPERNYEREPLPYIYAGMLLNARRKLALSPQELVKRLQLTEKMKVLELGPGPGYFSIEIARSIPGGSLVLVDIQQEMLDMVRKRLEEKGIGNVRLIQGDAISLPVESESFDAAMLALVLGEVPDQAGCLREIYRVLRPHGLLSLTEQSLDPDFIPLADLQALVESNGFRLEKTYGDSRNYTANFRKQ